MSFLACNCRNACPLRWEYGVRIKDNRLVYEPNVVRIRSFSWNRVNVYARYVQAMLLTNVEPCFRILLPFLTDSHEACFQR